MDNNANQKLNDLFNKARNEPLQVSFEVTKEHFLNNLSSSNAINGKEFTRFFNLKIIFMIASIITTIALVVVFKPNSTTKTNTKHISESELSIKTEQLILKEQQQVVTEYLQKVDKLTPQSILSNEENGETLLIPADSLKKYRKALIESVRITELLDTGYQFPMLTTEEIIANNKQKVKMIKHLDKLDKKQYAFIPSGTFKKGDENWSIQAFYMQTTEVTNLEYRTFLFDLLINDRKEEFLTAKPDQSRWVKDYPNSFNEPMQEHYFSHPAYNDYPVVAISREGAEMYCKWLTEEVNKQRKSNEFINDVRLPSNYEWEYAASDGGKHLPYPWGGPYVRNSKGFFLANFYPMKDNYIADGAFHTAKVNSYNPNDFGLYCMSGNVAEMVYYTDENNLAGTRGGSWTSIGQELQVIDGKDRFKGQVSPSVNIGFRPVISYFNKIINPPGTVRINDELYFDETEISNFSWREYVFWQAKKYGKTSKEYYDALPDTTVWRNNSTHNEPYIQYYFNHPAYNNYPVVGISYEQAVAFCKWRTERVKELFKIEASTDKKNIYPINFEYRLPSQAEWENIAKAGYNSINVKKDGDKHKFNLKRSKADLEGVASKLSDNADITAPTKSYWQNNYGIYNIIGNVAEMVQEKRIAKGGSWIHSAAEANLEKEIPYSKPESWLGFRCICEIKK